jgi:hypothetical protein
MTGKENKMNKTMKIMATFVQRAAEKREHSFKLLDNGSSISGNYTMSIGECCDQIGKEMNLQEDDCFPFRLALSANWNDILDWAKKVNGTA